MSEHRRHRFRAITGTVAVTLLAALVPVAPAHAAPPLSAAAACPGGTTVNIVAHEDDDILFLSPNLLDDVRGGRCVRTVFVTAGDAGLAADYWLGREEGAKAAYASMIGTSGTWTTSDAGIPGHPIPVVTHSANPKISLAFLRLPDGYGGGGGTETYGDESLQKLWQGDLATIHAVDDSSGYSKPELISTLTTLLTAYQPNTIRTQDYAGIYDDGDHSDHHSTAYLAQAAQLGYTTPHTFTGYQDYKTRLFPANVTGAALTAKQNAFYAYGAHDPFTCTDVVSCGDGLLARWLPRQYKIADNLAWSGTATASSQDLSTDQGAAKAIDRVVDGWGAPDGFNNDYTREWATAGGGAGSWLKVTWPSPKSISRIVLYDRPNADDQITGAALVFSNGTSVPVGTLDNGGMAKVVSFTPRTVTSVQLNITSVSGTTVNAGLAELEAYATTGP